MANNIATGPNSRMAIVSASLTAMGLTSDNCEIVFQAEGSYKSWKPGRIINAISTIEAGKGYIIISKKEMDMSAFFGLSIIGENPSISFEYVQDDNGKLII